MKRVIFLSLLIAACISINAQVASNCSIPTELQNNYNPDVLHLALQRIQNQNSPYKDSIDIPYSYQDTIWQGLAAIFNATSISYRDSVFDAYCIHDSSQTNTLYHTIRVYVDTSYDWTHNWENLNITTGLPALDSLISDYDFSIVAFHILPISHHGEAVLYTNQYVNIQPVCDSISTFSGVLYTDHEYHPTDGYTILYDKEGDERTFSFQLKWGDCPMGCNCTHSYDFKVYDNCFVEFLGIYHHCFGDPFPPRSNCNITTNVDKNKIVMPIDVYPNPSHDWLHIKLKDPLTTTFRLFNVQGQSVASETFTTSEQVINISDLPKGIYFWRALLGNSVSSGKLVVE